MKIDHEKLHEVVESLLMDVRGACSESSVVIGEIGGKQIKVVVTGDKDDFHTLNEKWECVTSGRAKKSSAQ